MLAPRSLPLHGVTRVWRIPKLNSQVPFLLVAVLGSKGLPLRAFAERFAMGDGRENSLVEFLGTNLSGGGAGAGELAAAKSSGAFVTHELSGTRFGVG